MGDTRPAWEPRPIVVAALVVVWLTRAVYGVPTHEGVATDAASVLSGRAGCEPLTVSGRESV